MMYSRAALPVAWFLCAAIFPGAPAGRAEAAADDSAASAPADQDDEDWALPPSDPWYDPQPQERGPRTGPGDALVFKARIAPHWFGDNARFWYRNDLAGGAREFVKVDAERGLREPAFDHAKLASALSKAAGGPAYEALHLPFENIELTSDAKAVRFSVGDTNWICDLTSYECTRDKEGKSTSPPAPSGTAPGRRPRDRGGAGDSLGTGGTNRSPDGKWVALVKDHNVFVRREGQTNDVRLSDDGKAGLAYGRLSWAPDSQTLVAFRIEPGERKEVYLIQSSPAGGGRAKLQARPYALPGDRFTAYELNLFDIATKKGVKPKLERVEFESPRVRWEKDGRHFTYEKIDRGHQRFRLIRVDSHTGQARDLIDEKSETFIWTAHREAFNFETVTWLDKSDEILYVSERDGWRHVYLLDAKSGTIKNPIIKGPFVVRGIDLVDEEKRELWFRASGRNPGQDPYFIHYYRVHFDGSGLVQLTDGNGSHSVQYSPDRRFLIDTYSRVDSAPVHRLRRAADGALVCKLEDADVSGLLATGWRAPEVFVAKGRDGKTDIWGIICRPKGYDPGKKYPVIEQIYAGPQGSFVPKTFSARSRFTFLTDLGFIVVQCDGMGTANRSKAFHDVCWHNIKDAGFPDRIRWHQAVAKGDPSYDISRVGIYGTSAGGQNATAGVLFHPEFYKVAASACGCHDNRMDKASWNEQWMGYPVGPWYSASSNIDNAHRLQGKLLLIVGELDTNVPPESTMRLVDALVKAGKDFELLVVPGANHGMGGAYGQRRLREFFVRHLLEAPVSAAADGSSRVASAVRPAPTDTLRPNSRSVQQESASAALDLEELNSEHSELKGAIERYTADRGSLARSAPADPAPERDQRVREFTSQWLDRLAKLDFDRFSQEGQVDYLLLKNHLAHELRQLDLRSRQSAESARLYPFARTILDLETARREIRPMEWPKVAGTLNGLTKEITDLRRAQEQDRRGAGAVRHVVASRALAAVESLTATLRTWHGFYDGYDPTLTWWVQEPYRTAEAALVSYAGFLRERYRAVTTGFGGDFTPGAGRRRGGGGPGPATTGGQDGGGSARAGARSDGSGRTGSPGGGGADDARQREIVGNPIGREALLIALQAEMISYSPEELIEIARAELAWCERRMKEAARAMGKADDWRAALDAVKSQYVEPGKQPALIRDLAAEAIEYMDANNLVTVPQLARDSWRMAMMSPERQLVNPFFTGGETISVSFPTAAMPHDAKLMSMRGNNIHFSRATVFHELIPGHHLQGYMTSRYKTYRRLFDTPFWDEGWALYWELLLWDRGFAKSPENRVGMLFWRMHRCARIIFSLGFHLEKMTPKECIDLLVDRIGHERDNATAEVRRSFTTSYGPLYQAAYLLGGLQIRALHRDLVESGRMTDREFHDAILKENSIPIAMDRALLTGQKLSPDFKPEWKFYTAPDGRD
jgi:dipeptidyl aminopeptidase/acylaminoacyl peptidase/uncharacterized protein (DUF885 family)